jgi:hypothetical protein
MDGGYLNNAWAMCSTLACNAYILFHLYWYTCKIYVTIISQLIQQCIARGNVFQETCFTIVASFNIAWPMEIGFTSFSNSLPMEMNLTS